MTMHAMTPFVCYHPTTGEILYNGVMSNGAVVHHRIMGEPFLPGSGTKRTHYVDVTNQVIVERETPLDPAIPEPVFPQNLGTIT